MENQKLLKSHEQAQDVNKWSVGMMRRTIITLNRQMLTSEWCRDNQI